MSFVTSTRRDSSTLDILFLIASLRPSSKLLEYIYLHISFFLFLFAWILHACGFVLNLILYLSRPMHDFFLVKKKKIEPMIFSTIFSLFFTTLIMSSFIIYMFLFFQIGAVQAVSREAYFTAIEGAILLHFLLFQVYFCKWPLFIII